MLENYVEFNCSNTQKQFQFHLSFKNKDYTNYHQFQRIENYYIAIYDKNDEDIIATFDTYEEMADYLLVSYEWLHRRIKINKYGFIRNLEIKNKIYKVYAFNY